jgi:hypothetical protein
MRGVAVRRRSEGKQYMGLWDAVRSWNYQAVMTHRGMTAAKQRKNAAAEAEDAVADAARALGHGGASVHMNKRVFVPQQRRCREVDVILVADALYVVEVKNWAGDIWRNGGRWFQKPPRENAQALEFGDLLEEIEFKSNALVQFLAHEHGIAMPPNSVLPCLVFTRAGCRLDPATVGCLPNVFTLDAFAQMVGPAAAASWLNPMAYFPTPFGTLARVQRAAINKAMDCIRTWDTIVLHNGEQITGDIMRLVLPEYQPADRALAGGPGSLVLARNEMTELSVDWAAASWFGIVAALFNGYGGCARMKLAPHCHVIYSGVAAPKQIAAPKAAAEEKKAEPVKKKQHLHGGEKQRHKHRVDGVDPAPAPAAAKKQQAPAAAAAAPVPRKVPQHSHQPKIHSPTSALVSRSDRVPAALTIPLTHKSIKSKSTGRTATTSDGVNHVVFRPAGKPQSDVVPLSHVRSIELSRVSKEDQQPTSFWGHDAKR